MSGRRRMPSYRPWGSTEDGAIEFESLTSETLNGALKILRESFFPKENVCQGVNLLGESGAAEELVKLCIDTARDGISVVAIDVGAQEVAGVAFNKLHVRGNPHEKSYFEKFSESCKCKSSKSLVDFMLNVDSRINLFEHYNSDGILEVMFLGTHHNYTKRRIGELLVSSSLEIGRQLYCGKNVKTPVEVNGDFTLTNADIMPSLVTAIMTSNYSKKISEKLGFDILLEVNFDEFEYDGKKLSERIDPSHKTSQLVAKKLS